MSEKHKKNYYGYTEAKKRANEKYNAKFREVKVRMLPERHEIVKKHAADHGESTKGQPVIGCPPSHLRFFNFTKIQFITQHPSIQPSAL